MALSLIACENNKETQKPFEEAKEVMQPTELTVVTSTVQSESADRLTQSEDKLFEAALTCCQMSEPETQSLDQTIENSNILELQKNDINVTNLFDETQTGDEVKAYEEFLMGKRAAYMADTVYENGFYEDILENGKKGGLFLERLMKNIVASMPDGAEGIQSVQYALIDCGNDNKKQLALRTYGMSYQYLNDDSDYTMVFDWQDGEVLLAYAVASWASDSHTLYANGYVSGYASGGISFYTSEGVIGADGIYRTNYECRITNGFRKIGSFYLEFWEKYGIKPVPVYFYEYTINDETIYAYSILRETTDVEEQIIQNYLRENEAATGVHLLTKDEAWERIIENRKALGITEEMGTEAHEIVWQELSDENLGSSFSIAEILKNEYKKKANTER